MRSYAATALLVPLLWSGCGATSAEIAEPAQVESSSAELWSNGDRDLTTNGYPSIGWVNPGGVIASKVPPALAGRSDVHLVDVLGGSTVRHQIWSRSNGWKPPIKLSMPNGATTAVGPGLAQRAGSSLLDLVVRGSDQYYHAYFDSVSWSAWEPIGGWGGDATVTSSTVGTSAVVDVWVTGGGSVWRRRWQSGWQAWQEIGHPLNKTLATAPGVVVRGDGTIDIAAGATTDGQLYHAFFSPAGTFSGWETIAGKTMVKPALTSPSSSRLDVWVKGATDGLVYHTYWNGSTWSGAEWAIDGAPSTAPPPAIATGIAAICSGLTTTVASVDSNFKLIVRSWADYVDASAAPTPTAVSTTSLSSTFAENSVAIVPPKPSDARAECRDGGILVSRGGTADLQRVPYACAINGTGQSAPGANGTCPPAGSTSLSNTASNDSQIVRMRDGRLVWVYQNGGVVAPRVNGCSNGAVTRGTETVRQSLDCGKTWTVMATLDPCVAGAFTTASTCNTNAIAVNTNNCWGGTSVPPTGTDRPELMASSYDDTVYMAVGVAGTSAFNLHLLKSNAASLGTWTDLDTGLGSGGAVAMTETQNQIYFARAEYGSPSNMGLYTVARSAPFTRASLVFLGNLADRDVAGNVQLSVLSDTGGDGDPVFRWAYLTAAGAIRRGFSKLTPGGLVTVSTGTYTPQNGVANLPTMVSSQTLSRRALLYWYEGTGTTFSIKGAISDGVGRWSAPITLAGSFASGLINQIGFSGSGSDYLKGAYVTSNDSFYALWLQPDSAFGVNRLGQATVK